MTDESHLALIKQRLESAEKSIASVKKLISDLEHGSVPIQPGKIEDKAKDLAMNDRGDVIEGVFNGENMIGPDKKEYPVPQNYASKSKLIEGDILKLTVGQDGSFMYKQIGPVERKRIVGILHQTENGDYGVKVKNKNYQVLLASVTYFNAQIGDKVTLVVPKDTKADWGAIENVMKETLFEEIKKAKVKKYDAKKEGIEELEAISGMADEGVDGLETI